MGKQLKIFLAAAVIAAGLGAGAITGAAEESASIEQVYVNLPEVTLYGSGISDGITEAYLGDRKLENAGVVPFAQTGEPIYYYLLLDVSNSMPEAYFDKIKQSIQSFEGSLGENDRMLLYTFGESVELKLDENHTPADTQAVLASIDNVDNKTLLFEAVSQAADKADQVPAAVCKRRVLAVISDGEDFTVGKTGVQEAQDNLAKKGIPAYAFAIEDTARENINNFGTFSRNSGGQMVVFGGEQADTVLNDFHQKLEAYDVVNLKGSDNLVSNSMEAFTAKTASNQTLTRDVLVSRYIPDQTAPVIIRAEKVEADQIELEFSEPVKGADAASSYTVTREGKTEKKKDKDKDKDEEKDDDKAEDKADADDATASEADDKASGDETSDENADSNKDSGKESDKDSDKKVAAVASVSVVQDAENTVLLTFTSDLKPGTYKVSCTNITDVSMERHQVVNSAEFEVEQPPLGTRILNAIQSWYWILLVLIAAALIAVVCIIYRKVKKGRGVIYVDGKPVIASDVEIHKHVAIQEQEGMPFQARVSVKGNKPEDLELSIADSFIVGRSQICNLYFDDKRMSRQHFALEWDGQDMYVTDLETTNGTLVNGVKINKRRRLQPNDKISAGSVEMTIRW